MLFLCLVLVCIQMQAQDSLVVEETYQYSEASDIHQQREFKDNLKSKYSGREFTYKDDIKAEKPKPKPKPTTYPNLSAFFIVLAQLLPYLLGILVVFIIIRSFVDFDSNFWRFKKPKKSSIALTIENEEDIAENDFESLLEHAIKNKDYRLSTRYYYLLLLQKLAEKKLIDYNIDKTNADYLLELKEAKMKDQFSFLSYIYNYVWYGEFPVNDIKFKTIQDNYTSFIKTI